MDTIVKSNVSECDKSMLTEWKYEEKIGKKTVTKALLMQIK